MSEIYAPGSIPGPQGPAGPAGSAAAMSALAGSLAPSFAGRNLFDISKVTNGAWPLLADGTLVTFAGTNSSGLIYCPGATSLVSNLSVDSGRWGPEAVCLYDANGGFLSALAPSAFASPSNGCAIAGTNIALPGTQTYVRFAYVPSFAGSNGWVADSAGMVYAAITGIATLPATFQPCGLDTVADVNAKDAVVAANAAAALSSAFSGGVELALKTTLPFPPGAGTNLFDSTKNLDGFQVNTDGTVTAGGWTTATIYCPGATGFISNVPIRGVPNGRGFCLYDALGNFIEDLSTTTLASAWVTGNCLTPCVAYALPGTQTYIKFSYAASNYGGYSFANGDGAAQFICGDATTACPASLPQGSPCFSKPVTTIKTASQLGCALDSNLSAGGGTDCTSLLNAFLATASAASPVKLILDGPCLVTGLVIARAGYTTIEGIGRGSGIYLANGAYQDGVRIGAYTAATGASEGAYNLAAPAQSATNITLRNFTINMNGVNNPSPTAANVPVAGAAAHCIFATILANCTDVVVEGMNYLKPPFFNLTFSNASNIRVSGCEFSSTGYGRDGIHIDGLCSDITISDCAFATGDDAIALNAPEGYGGDISRVTVTNCRFNNALTVMRIYTSLDVAAMPGNNVHKVCNVAVSNCAGTLTSVCFNLGITNGGLSSTADADQIQDLTVSNCSFASPQGLALLLAPAGSLVFRGIAFTPTGASSLISGYFSGIGELVLDDVRVLRNPVGNAVLDSFVLLCAGLTMDRVTLLNCRAVDEEGSSYPAHTSLIDCQGTIAALRLEAIDMTHIAALASGAGWTGVTALRGGGVLGTGAQVPDSVMDSNALYLSSNASGALSLKLGGTAKRLTLA